MQAAVTRAAEAVGAGRRMVGPLDHDDAIRTAAALLDLVPVVWITSTPHPHGCGASEYFALWRPA
jgi:hypothetical protein